MSLLHSWLQHQLLCQQIPKATKLLLKYCGYKIDFGSFQLAAYRGGKRKRGQSHIYSSSLDIKIADVSEE